MTFKPQQKSSKRKGKGFSPTQIDEHIARLYKPFDYSLPFRRLSAAMMPRTPSLADSFNQFNAKSDIWSGMAKIDWTKSDRLYSEALRAMDVSSAIQRQNEALLAGGWDVDRLRNVFSSTQTSISEENPDDGLESEIRKLREEIESQSAALTAEEKNKVELQDLITERDKNIHNLQLKIRLAFLLQQVHPVARRLLEVDKSFREKFEAKECSGFVVSVDIRRSTELMLKARQPEQYAEFVSELSGQLTKEILGSFGVFDKFTGDGILAFFPEFYSGKDAGFHAASAALRCHQIFQNHYRKHRSRFISILQDTGLGIGIDYGNLHLVQVSGALTVVGPPVVYACRLGGAPAGSTYINQPAYEELSNNYGNYLHFEETSLNLKHEGAILAYRVTSTAKAFAPQQPEWANSNILDNGSNDASECSNG